MKKQTYFSKLIAQNRKLLLSLGYPAPTLTCWTQGVKVPRHARAIQLCADLTKNGIPVTLGDIPYGQYERHLD